MKTAVLYAVNGQKSAKPAPIPQGQLRADLAASFQEAVVDVLVAKCLHALHKCGRTALCVGGGVAANTRLRERLAEASLAEGCTLVIPPLALCTDNAAMSAIAWELLAAGRTAGLDLDVSAGLVRRRKQSPPSV